MSLHRKSLFGSAVLGLTLLCSPLVSSWVRADDEDHLAKAPAVVQATVKKILGEGKLEGFDTEDYKGKPAYDVDMSIKGTSYAMLIAEDGQVIQREVEVNIAMVPQAVIDAGMKAHPEAKIHEASIITRGEEMFYELEMFMGKVEHDVEITAGGKVLTDTVAKAEAKEAAEKDEKDEKGEAKDKKESK